MEIDRMRELTRRSFDCYRTADRAGMESLLHPKFIFTSPYDDHIDRKTYFERCWPLAGTFEYHDLKEIVPAKTGCLVCYEGKSRTGAYFRNVELFTFDDGLIRTVEVFFGLPPHTKPQRPPGAD